MKESKEVQQKLSTELSTKIQGVELEYCFNIEHNTTHLQETEIEKILWLITETFEPELVSETRSFLTIQNRSERFISLYKTVQQIFTLLSSTLTLISVMRF